MSLILLSKNNIIKWGLAEIMHIEYKGILVQFSVLCFLKSWLKKKVIWTRQGKSTFEKLGHKKDKLQKLVYLSGEGFEEDAIAIYEN